MLTPEVNGLLLRTMKTEITNTAAGGTPVIEFTAPLVREYSYGPSEIIGERKHRMEFVLNGPGYGLIIWNWGKDAPDEDELVIGIWTEGKAVVDYDGVFDLPSEARRLLIDAGYDLEPLGIDAAGNDID